jgi:hypothetical protein
MKHLNRIAVGALLAGSLSLVACGGGDDVDGTPDAGGNNNNVTTGTYNHYVTNSVKVGATASEADSYGFALDDKPPTRDNQIGKTLANFASQLMIDAEIDEALKLGQFVILHSVRADALDADPSVSWQVFIGEPKTSPVFDGTGTFTVNATAPTGKLIGSITGGKYTATPGTVSLALSLSSDQAPLQVTLNGARIEANITATGCTNGKIGGAVKVADLENNIIPFLAMQLDAQVGKDTGCRDDLNMCETTTRLLLGIFDTDQNRIITVAEVKANDAVKGVLAPDVDVLKADGTLGTDGTPDSVSIGLGFGCAKGVFTAPGEGT